MPTFSDLVKNFGKGIKNVITLGQNAARNWYRETAQRITGVNVNDILRSNPDRFLKTTKIGVDTIGRMLMFFYDPKLKKELPFYDRFPLIFPIESYKDGFLGINMHYLPYYARAKLMDALYTTLNSPRTREQKLKISYEILKGASKYKLFRPCIKRYLYSHVRSRYFIVKPEEWDMVLCLPLERFERGGKGGRAVGGSITKNEVWADSMRQVRRRS
jgi:hypothetical protein